MTTPLRPGQTVTFYPLAGKPGVDAEIKAVTQRSRFRPAQVKISYRPYRARKPQTQTLPLALFAACLAPRTSSKPATP